MEEINRRKMSTDLDEEDFEQSKKEAKKLIDESESYILVARGERREDSLELSNMVAGDWMGHELKLAITKLTENLFGAMEDNDLL